MIVLAPRSSWADVWRCRWVIPEGALIVCPAHITDPEQASLVLMPGSKWIDIGRTLRTTNRLLPWLTEVNQRNGLGLLRKALGYHGWWDCPFAVQFHSTGESVICKSHETRIDVYIGGIERDLRFLRPTLRIFGGILML